MSTTALPLAIASSSSSLADHPADGALSNDSAQFWRPDPKAERRRASPAQIVLELLRPSPVHALLLGNAGAAQIDVYLSCSGPRVANSHVGGAPQRAGAAAFGDVVHLLEAWKPGPTEFACLRTGRGPGRLNPVASSQAWTHVIVEVRGADAGLGQVQVLGPAESASASQPPPPVAVAAPAGPQCSHARPSRLATVKKGPNVGRSFWICSLPPARGGCGFVAWAATEGEPSAAAAAERARREAAEAAEAAEAEQLAAEEAWARKAEEEAAARRAAAAAAAAAAASEATEADSFPVPGGTQADSAAAASAATGGGDDDETEAPSAKRQRRLEFSANGEPPTPSDAVASEAEAVSPALSVAPPRQLNAITAPAAAEPSAASAAELHTPAPMRSLSPSPRCPPPPPEVAERAGAPAAAAAASERGGDDGSGLIVTVGDGPPALELTLVDAENACGDGEVGLPAVIRIAADAVTIGRGADADVVLDSKQYPQMVSRIHCRLERSADGGGAWTVAERGSANGTAVSDDGDGGWTRVKRATGAVALRDGAVLCIGSWRGKAPSEVRYRVAVLDAAAEEEPSPSAEAAPPGWAQLESQVW